MQPILSFMFLLGFIFLQSSSSFSQAAIKRIESLEDQRFQAQVSQNTDLLQTLLSEEVQLIHSNAYVEDKKAFLDNVASGRIGYSSMQAGPDRKILIKKKMAISRGILSVSGSYKGKSFDIKLRYTAIYEKVKGQWLLLNWQSTKISE